MTEPQDGHEVYRFSLSVDHEVIAHKFVYHHDTPRERVPGMEDAFYKKAPNFTHEWAVYQCYTHHGREWRLTGRTDTEFVMVPDGRFKRFKTYREAHEASVKALRQRIERLKRDLTTTENRLTMSLSTEWSVP